MRKRICLWLILPRRNLAKFLSRFSFIFISALALAACGGGGGGSNSASGANTGTTPAPSVTFSAASTSLAVGQSTSLNWSSSNADSCTASGGWTGTKGTSGTETVGPLQQTTSFTLSCSGAGGGTLREVNVSVGQSTDISVNLTSNVPAVLDGGQAQLSWSSSNAESCEASGDWTGQQELNGSFTTPALTKSATYKLTCFAQGRSAVALVTVEVSNLTVTWQAPTENTDGSALTDLTGFKVYWGTSPRSYSDNVSLTSSARSWDISLASGTYYIAVTALDADANESSYSNEIRRIVP